MMFRIRVPGLLALATLALAMLACVHAADLAVGPWCGGVTADHATVKVQLSAPGKVVVRVATKADLAGAVATAEAASAVDNIATCELTGLTAGTRYHYAVAIDGVLDQAHHGSFQTLPVGPASFHFAFASCAVTGSDHEIFALIKQKDPLFFMQIGDWGYDNITANNPALFRKAWLTNLAAPRQADLFRNVALIYDWDDHDSGPNDGNRTSPSRAASMQAYREMIPTHALAAGDQGKAIYRAFTVGRCRFILTDLRSLRDPGSEPDGPQKTMMGAEQKAWFKQELLAAKGTFPVIFWVSTVTWIGAGTSTGDQWGGFPTERAEIAGFIKDNHIDGMCILAGDAHMLAADDGRGTDFAPGFGSPVMRQLSAAPLDRGASKKGGPYSVTPYLPPKGEGCCGFVTVDDKGTEIRVDYSGRNHKDEEKVKLSFTVPVKP